MSAQILPGEAELAAYLAQLAPTANDELRSAALSQEPGLLATAIQTLGLAGLRAASQEAERLVGAEGIQFGGLAGRDWVIDPLPVVIEHDQWQQLAAGLKQRARLLSLLAGDLYGEQRLLTSGAIPAEIIWGHRGFLHQVCGSTPPADIWLPNLATDLGRGSDGSWQVIDDRTDVISGLGYAMTNRRITSRVLGELASDPRLARLRGYFTTLRAGLQQLSPNPERVPRGVLLWSGPDSETAFEQGFLATLLGYPLVEAEDLRLRAGQVWLNSNEGQWQVDVILRRVESLASDPLEFNPDSEFGLAGLLEATRLGNVAIANPLGAGVLENPALLPLLPELSRQLLGEELQLAAAQTWWCGDPAQLSHVLTNLKQLVIKPIQRAPRASSRFGWELSADQRASLAAQLKAEPWAWCGQAPLPLATAPVVTASGLQPRPLVLRCFANYLKSQWEIMPGGLARVATSDAFRITNTSGALAKDVWVLDPQDAPVEAWSDSWQRDRTTDPIAAVAPRVAGNLVWLGRYTERADAMVRLLRYSVDAAKDHGRRPESLAAKALAVVLAAAEQVTGIELGSQDVQQAMPKLRQAITDRQQTGSVAHAVAGLQQAAHRVPDLMSRDLWLVVNRLSDGLTQANVGHRDPRAVLAELQESTLALAGINAESLTRDATWGFIDAGVRLERAQYSLALIAKALGQERAAILDALVHDALLEIGESVITFRRRTAAGQGPVRPAAASLSLLLSDQLNPRSVAFQLGRLTADLQLIGDEPAAEAAEQLRTELVSADSAALLAADRSGLAKFATAALDSLREISDDLLRQHLTRPAPRRPTLVGWVGGSEPLAKVEAQT